MNTNTHPRGTITGYSHSKCYARADQNCSKKISKEHFISKTLLMQIQLNNTAKIAGLSWQQNETFNIIPVSGLASRILCERHNNALSTLDACMGSFAQSIADYDAALNSNATSDASEIRTYSGDDLERWMVKALLGLTASNNLAATNLEPECVDLLFANTAWPEGWGLYFALSSKQIHHSASFLIETKVDPARALILAANFTIRGVPFVLCLGKPDNPQSFGQFRPEAIVFRNGACEKVLELKWLHGAQSQAILLNHAGRYDGPPPDWNEWERNG
jgi:hypothetical protein